MSAGYGMDIPEYESNIPGRGKDAPALQDAPFCRNML
jgi:hypothetical protein